MKKPRRVYVVYEDITRIGDFEVTWGEPVVWRKLAHACEYYDIKIKPIYAVLFRAKTIGAPIQWKGYDRNGLEAGVRYRIEQAFECDRKNLPPH